MGFFLSPSFCHIEGHIYKYLYEEAIRSMIIMQQDCGLLTECMYLVCIWFMYALCMVCIWFVCLGGARTSLLGHFVKRSSVMVVTCAFACSSFSCRASCSSCSNLSELYHRAAKESQRSKKLECETERERERGLQTNCNSRMTPT